MVKKWNKILEANLFKQFPCSWPDVDSSTDLSKLWCSFVYVDCDFVVFVKDVKSHGKCDSNDASASTKARDVVSNENFKKAKCFTLWLHEYVLVETFGTEV